MKFTDQYRQQRSHARRRGIEFKLTYEDWLGFWGDDVEKRGRRLHDLQMCRFGDKGAYEVGNIYKATGLQNCIDRITNKLGSKPKALQGEIIATVSGLLEMGVSTRSIAYLVNCSQKQIVNFKNKKGAYQ